MIRLLQLDLSDATYVGLCESKQNQISPEGAELVDCGNVSCSHRVVVSSDTLEQAKRCLEILCVCCALKKMQRLETELPYR